MAHKTIRDVELVRSGTWEASTGEITISGDDLAAMLEAWSDDRLPLPVIKIGHTDPRMENPEWDGEPAYGQVTNLRIEGREDAEVLIGDYVNVPEELATKLVSAYPQRSVEIHWGVELRDEANEVTHTYPAVLTAVALLGATPPAVKGLADVHANFKQRASNFSVNYRPGSGTRLSVRMAYPAGHTSTTLREALDEAVRKANPNAAFAFVEDFDDNTVWYQVEDDSDVDIPRSDVLNQEGYQVAADGSVELDGSPTLVQVRRTYEPVEEPADQGPEGLSTVPHGGRQERQSKSVDAKPKKSAASARPERGEPMFTEDQLRVLRGKFGLAEDATEEDVLAAINTDAEPDEENQDTTDEVEPTDEDLRKIEEVENVEPFQDEREPVAASGEEQDPATVTLSQASFAQMQTTLRQQGAELAEIRAERAKGRRDQAIRDALKAGRIHRNDANHWREKLDRDEQGTIDTLQRLTPVVPTSELGADAAPNFLEADETIDKDTAELDAKVFGRGGK